MNCKVEQRGFNKPILVVDISNGGFNCSHWGLTDLYEECEKNLRDLLKTGVDFETEWCSSKKELLSARYRRKNGSVWVDVNQWIDDLWEGAGPDLIEDAVWARFHREDIAIPSEGYDFILQLCREMEIDDTIVISEEVGEDATYEDCMATVEVLMGKTDAQLNEWFEELCNIIEDYVRSTGLDKKGDAE